MSRPVSFTHNPTFQLCAGGVIALALFLFSFAVWLAIGRGLWMALKAVAE